MNTDPPPLTGPPVATTPPKIGWGGPVISVYSLTLLLIALVFAFFTKNENLLVILAGVVATNATTVVGFYVGSSRSSQAKDETISAQLLLPPPSRVTPS